MRKYFLIFAVIFSALQLSLASAQNTSPDVSAALSAWTQAVEKGTVEDIVSLYDNDAVMFSAFANDPLTSKEQLRGYYAKVVKEQNRKVDVMTQNVRVFGNVASNTGTYKFHYEQDGEPLDLPARFTFVYVMKDGKWKIISHHSSLVPSVAK